MEHVNDIINNLCEKLGTTVEYIVPEYDKMKIVEGLSQIGICGIILVLSLICLFVSHRMHSKLDETDRFTETEVWMAILVGSGVTSLFSIMAFVIVLIIEMPRVLTYYYTPYAAFVEDVIQNTFAY